MEQVENKVRQAKRIISQLVADRGNAYKVSLYLGINPAHIYFLKKGRLSPTLFQALVQIGAMEPDPPTVEILESEYKELLRNQRKRRVRRKPTQRSPRFSVLKNDPERAAAAIRNHMVSEHIDILVSFLVDEDGHYE